MAISQFPCNSLIPTPLSYTVNVINFYMKMAGSKRTKIGCPKHQAQCMPHMVNCPDH